MAIMLAFAAGGLRADELRIETLELTQAPALSAPVVAGEHDGKFRPAGATPLRLDGGAGRRHWLRISFTLPTDEDPRLAPRVLRFDRVAFDRIKAWMPEPDGSTHAFEDSFFRPSPDGSLGPNSFAFALPNFGGGQQHVYVAIDSIAGVSLTPQLMRAREFHAGERTASALLAATYAAILVLMLTSLALFLALRDRAQLHFAALTSSVLLLLLAVNGHAYRVPLLDLLAWWRGNGVYALAMLSAGLALGFTRHFLASVQASTGVTRLLVRAGQVLFGLGAACLLNIAALDATLQALAGVAAVGATLLIVAVSLRAWRQGEELARAYSLVWAVLALAVAARIALAHGWLPQNPATLYGFQLALAFGMFLLSIGLADRVMEFRKQRDRARQQKEQTDANLQQEQARRRFAEGLRELLRRAPLGGDLQWVALHRLLASLREALPQRGAAVVAHGYHGADLLIVEPIDAQERYRELVEARQARLKNFCRARKPVQAALEDSSALLEDEPESEAHAPAQFAIVPLPIAAPGWGALLLEREAGAQFDPDELRLAAEFVALAIAATDEAMGQAELKRKAEMDPLTGACNRRAGDALAKQLLKRALAERQPYALLFVDLDHFKQVNDRHGHAVGDDCLRRAAQTIRAELAAQDVLVRYGGEEFLVLAPGRGPEASRALGEQIRQSVLAIRIENGSGPVRFTVSIGIASRLPGEDDPQTIVERADRALYTAKHNGRNQVQAAPSYGYGKSGQDAAPPPPLSL